MSDIAKLHQRLSEALAIMAVPVPVRDKIDEVFAEAQMGKIAAEKAAADKAAVDKAAAEKAAAAAKAAKDAADKAAAAKTSFKR